MSSPTEVHIRKQVIDRQLVRAGWNNHQRSLIEELRLPPLLGQTAEEVSLYETREGFVDYALLGRDSRPLAIVEAKRSSRDAVAGKRQAADYADRIHAHYGIEPFIFLGNGETIWFWDRERYPPRLVNGFFTRDDLERLAFQRYYRQPLSQISPDVNIVDRLYQHEAIRRVTERMEQARRSFLLVMATGTGKTRTVIALIDLLMRAKWVQRVLFLADRRELVRQALADFKEYIPHETRTRIEGGDLDHTARIHVATYPSMMQIFHQLSPAYYDLVIVDESHRSIYNRYKALLDHFDAITIGLTATPTDYIDHNTFQLFDCPDGLPTFYYPFETAVREGYLVNYRVLDAQTTFQIEGIKAGQLPPEAQHQLVAQGIELSELDFEGSDLERRVSNTGTNDAMVQEFMAHCRKDSSGTPTKSIIFAISHHHAVGLWESFNRHYPDQQRRGLAEIIDSHMERTDQLLDDFKYRDMPRVAISVDMLDTGVDVPAVQTLVFAKPVFSEVKFWQMIGRGARLWTDLQTGREKKDFLIIDHWANFAYFSMNPQGEIVSHTEPLPVRLFRLRLEKLLLLRGQDESVATADTVGQMQRMLARLPSDNINVRPFLSDLAELQQQRAWIILDTEELNRLNNGIAPLLRFLPKVNLPVMNFEARTEQLAVAFLSNQAEVIDTLREQIIDDLRALPLEIDEVQQQATKIAFMTSVPFWEHLSYARIMELQTAFAPLMRYRQRHRREMMTLSLPDTIARRRWIVYGPAGEGAFAENYRDQVEARIKQLADELPALARLKRGSPVSEEELDELVATLNRPDLFVTVDVLRQVYDQPDASLRDFLRHILGLSHLPSREEQLKAAFDAFIATHPHFTAMQITFMRTVRSAVLRQAQLVTEDLQRPPFTRVGVAQQLFSVEELNEILAFANRLAA